MTTPLLLVSSPASVLMLAAICTISGAAFLRPSMRAAWMLRPYDVIHRRKWYLVIAYGFVHADIVHLLFNVVSMYSITFLIEQRMGSVHFVIVFLGSLVLGALPTTIRRRNDPSYRSLGASGAVSGLFFSGMLYFPSGSVSLFFVPIGIPFPLFGALFLAFSYYGARRNLGPIGHEVHLFGALAGFLLTALLDPSVCASFLAYLLPAH